uniref:Uncharacterized protein n=1 Tax=Anguilla anguilla TaxID=7936 RepID=A0A0E9WZP6_ANGAN
MLFIIYAVFFLFGFFCFFWTIGFKGIFQWEPTGFFFVIENMRCTQIQPKISMVQMTCEETLENKSIHTCSHSITLPTDHVKMAALSLVGKKACGQTVSTTPCEIL